MLKERFIWCQQRKRWTSQTTTYEQPVLLTNCEFIHEFCHTCKGNKKGVILGVVHKAPDQITDGLPRVWFNGVDWRVRSGTVSQAKLILLCPSGRAYVVLEKE